MFAKVVSKIFDAVTMTGTAAVNSVVLNIENCARVSFQGVWTGTPNGTFTFKVCNDPYALDRQGNVLAGATFTTLSVPGSFASGNPAGSASSFEFEFDGMGCLYMMVTYTNASSTGVLNMWAHAKA